VPSEPEVLTFSEAMALLRVSEETLRKMCRQKKIPHIRTSGKKPNSRYRFNRASLLAWIGGQS